MKKVNRYTLGIKEEFVTKSLSKYTAREIVDYITEYNSNPRNPYFLGNIEFNYNMGIATYYKFKKITEPSTLEEIDIMTSKYENDYELKQVYNISKNNHDIVIMYRYNKDIRTLPVIYKKYNYLLGISLENNKYYLGKNKRKLERELSLNSDKIEFINMILSEGRIEQGARESVEDFDRLYALRDALRSKNPSVPKEYLVDFYKKFIYEKGTFNYFNYRLILTAYIKYIRSLEKKPTTSYDEQLSIECYDIKALRDFYEELKIARMNGDYNEVYSEGIKKLKK